MPMTPDRRYSDDEIAEILEGATEAQKAGHRPLSSGDGVTLAELQEIGREVGISEELIARAASRLDAPPVPASPHVEFLKTPIGVGRTVHLDRPVSDREWDRLVVDLRETFNARGRLREEGSFRQWTNGNLQALLEPTDSGDRLRLKTLKSDGMASLGVSALMMAAGPVSLVWAGDFRSLAMSLLLTLAGGLLFGAARLRLRSWAATRERQMEDISNRLVAAIQEGDRPGPGEPDRRLE